MSPLSLIVFLTRRCRNGCPTCNVSAAPESKSGLDAGQLDALFAHPRVSGSGIRHVVWTGGEPFENFEPLIYGLKTAEKKGWRSEILTAGYWYLSRPGLLRRLLKAGHFSLRVSIDREHLRNTASGTLLKLAGECVSLNIPLNFTVRDLPGDRSWEEIRNRLEEKFPEYTGERGKDPRWVHRIPHVPVTRDDPYPLNGSMSVSPAGCSMAFRDLVTGWDGNFYPCCGLFSLPGFRKYALGGVGKPAPRGGRAEELFARIREKGPGVIREISGSSHPVKDRIPYRNQCHACLDLLRTHAEPVDRYLAGENLRG